MLKLQGSGLEFSQGKLQHPTREMWSFKCRIFLFLATQKLSLFWRIVATTFTMFGLNVRSTIIGWSQMLRQCKPSLGWHKSCVGLEVLQKCDNALWCHSRWNVVSCVIWIEPPCSRALNTSCWGGEVHWLGSYSASYLQAILQMPFLPPLLTSRSKWDWEFLHQHASHLYIARGGEISGLEEFVYENLYNLFILNPNKARCENLAWKDGCLE